MTSKLFAQNPAYTQYESNLHQLHELIARGEGESAEAERLRDQMDGFYARLSYEEVKRLDGLAADLYMLSNDEVLQPGAANAMAVDEFRQYLHAKEQAADWDGVLALLRTRPASSPLAGVAFTRYRAYEALGHLSTAALFFEYFAQRVMVDWRVEAMRLQLLNGLKRSEEAVGLALRLLSRPDAQPELVILATETLIDAADDASVTNRQLLDSLAARVHRTLLQAVPSPKFAELGWLIVAECMRRLNNRPAELDALNALLALSPGDVEVRAMRDVLERDEPANEASLLADRRKSLFADSMHTIATVAA